MINVGVIGAGPGWEQHRKALARLRRPVHVRAIYDAVPARADHAASAIQAESIGGLSGFIGRPDISALLVLDPGWVGLKAVELLAESGHPLFIAPWLQASAQGYEALFSIAEEHSLTMMPALWRRFMPSAMRMQELIATQLGRLKHLTFSVALPGEPSAACEELTGWLDFCRLLFRVFPVGASMNEADDGSVILTIAYPVPGRRDSPGDQAHAERTATILLTGRKTTSIDLHSLRRILQAESDGVDLHAPPEAMVPTIECRCENGTATILDRTNLRWADAAGETHDESLTSDRPEADVMLDLFFRRVVGGLIPVADYNDLASSLRLLETTLDSDA